MDSTLLNSLGSSLALSQGDSCNNTFDYGNNAFFSGFRDSLPGNNPLWSYQAGQDTLCSFYEWMNTCQPNPCNYNSTDSASFGNPWWVPGGNCAPPCNTAGGWTPIPGADTPSKKPCDPCKDKTTTAQVKHEDGKRTELASYAASDKHYDETSNNNDYLEMMEIFTPEVTQRLKDKFSHVEGEWALSSSTDVNSAETLYKGFFLNQDNYKDEELIALTKTDSIGAAKSKLQKACRTFYEYNRNNDSPSSFPISIEGGDLSHEDVAMRHYLDTALNIETETKGNCERRIISLWNPKALAGLKQIWARIAGNTANKIDPYTPTQITVDLDGERFTGTQMDVFVQWWNKKHGATEGFINNGTTEFSEQVALMSNFHNDWWSDEKVSFEDLDDLLQQFTNKDGKYCHTAKNIRGENVEGSSSGSEQLASNSPITAGYARYGGLD